MDQLILAPNRLAATSINVGFKWTARPSRVGRAALVMALFVGVSAFFSGVGVATAAPEATIQSLDEQVQVIKSDVLAIAAELSNLEEKLLHPSDTQVAVFVTLAEDTDTKGLELDSIQVSIDGDPVADHVYSWKEIEALAKGGVQRIHTGNLRTGPHRIDVQVSGRLANGKDFEQTQQIGFRKDIEPKRLGITLTGGGSGGATVAVGEW
jgi:hypothetical protein